MPWVINPLLAALSIIVFYYLGKEIYGESEGRWAAILGSLSIWFLLMSSTMLSHTSSMFFFSVFLLFLFKSLNSPSLRNGLVAGLGVGIAFLIRPYSVAVISVPLLIYIGFQFLMRPRARLKNMVGLTTALVIAVLCLLIYNQISNGNPLRMGYMEKYGEAHSIGFGRTGYLGVPHTPARGFSLIGENLGAINKYLFGWPLSSLLFFIPFLFPLKEDKKRLVADRLLTLSFFSLTIGLFFYWGTRVFVGARMFFESFPILVLITSRGISKTPIILSQLTNSLSIFSIKRRLQYSLGILTLFAFIFTFPGWINPHDTNSYNEVFTRDFSGVTHRINNTINQLSLGRSLVIMKFLFRPQEHFPGGWWGSGFLYNDPNLQNRIIYAQDQGAANIDLFNCFPGRDIFLYTGTLEKGMLIPLDLTANQLHYGEPVFFHPQNKNLIDLVERPQEMFLSYSSAFRMYLDTIYTKYSFYDIDVIRLIQLSKQANKEGEMVTASFHLEAALQIENNPFVRHQLLGQLAFLYIKIGNIVEAKRIYARLADPQDPHVYGVFPEKGF
jgi:hypothetical protein